MYLRVCFIAGFGIALHFFYFPRFKTTIDLFSADKKIATRIASTSLCSMFTKVNIPFVCIANSPLLSERENELTESQNLPRNGEVIGGEVYIKIKCNKIKKTS